MARKEPQNALKRSLGLLDATAISVGAIIGGGIFVVTGIVAGLAGSALVVSMVVAAAIAFFTALSFAELAAWQPVEGSVYEYARQVISPFSGFLAGWMWIVSNTFTGAAVSLGFAYYLTASFPSLPANVVAAVLCLAFTALNFFGARESARLNTILVAAKLLILGFFVVFGAFSANSANFAPFEPFNAGVLYGAYFIFFAYTGFARAAVVAEEVKDAKRNVPKALLFSLAISTIIYVLVGIVAVGLVGSTELEDSYSPLAQAIGASGSPLAVQVVSIGGLLATASVLLTAILGVSRMAYSMARKKDLPQVLAKLHQKFSTPHYAIWVVGILMAALVLFFDLTGVVAVSTFGALFYYAFTNASALKLKTEQRRYHKIAPILGLGTCIVLLAFILFEVTQAWIIGGICLVAGAVYYGAKKYASKRAAEK
ncbi:MAG: APC family permease [Candidatus Bathyarchaeota archaeon]|nr:APC family permease [Candidatus Bathyarchaeota archaeon]